jgi:hypothetical protein
MPTTKITGSEIANAVEVGTIYGVTEGAVTLQEILGAYRHPKMRILRIWSLDCVGTTASNISILKGAAGAITIVAATALTVAALGNVTNLTAAIVSGTEIIAESEAIQITTSGANDKVFTFIEFEQVE